MASKFASEENYDFNSGDESNNAKNSRSNSPPVANLDSQRIYNDISQRGGGPQGADHKNCKRCGACNSRMREFRCGCRVWICDTCFRKNPNCPCHPQQKEKL